MIQNENPLLATSLWDATANPAAPYPTLSEEADCDFAIVGGGYAGLSAALHLAEQGRTVALLEAERIGWGASGRNGGQVIAGLKEDPEGLLRAFGPEMGPRVIRLSGGAPDLVFELIQRHAIACDAVRKGWIQPAHNEAALAVSRRRSADWQRHGAPVEPLDRAQVADLLGSPVYVGGLLDRRGGGLHPLNYALGLAAAAHQAGARLFEGSRATGLVREADGYRLTTAAGGCLRARAVLLCTNGYADGLHDRLRRGIVAVRSVQVASAPLPEALRASLFPEGHVASDTRRLLAYFRLDAAGRLLMGGRGAFTDGGLRKQFAALRQRAHTTFPHLGALDWQFHWGGRIAMTQDHFPRLMELAPGLYALQGFNGRGVAMATALGRVLAERAAGRPAAELDYPVAPLKPLRFHSLHRPVVSLLIEWNRLLDKLGK